MSKAGLAKDMQVQLRETKKTTHQARCPSLKSPQPPPITLRSLTSLGLRIVIVHVDSVRLALETRPRHLAVDPDVVHERLETDVVVFRPDVAQHQQIEGRAVEVGEVVEFGTGVGFGWGVGDGEVWEDVNFL